jgi:DNA-binding PadR family transcriptional regulator
MRHHHGFGRFKSPDHGFGRGHRAEHGRHRGGRVFDYGELRLLILALLGEKPSHGYELIKAIEERLGGAYSPSPGVIYPTLTWLYEMGYAAKVAEDQGRKRYQITPEGLAFLDANRAAVDELMARVAKGDHGGAPAPVLRAMQNLKVALRLRLRQGALDDATAATIAAALDQAAQAVERS